MSVAINSNIKPFTIVFMVMPDDVMIYGGEIGGLVNFYVG